MISLFGDYSYKIVEHKEMQVIFKSNRAKVFGETFTIEVEQFYTEKEADFLKSLPHSSIYRLYILVYDKGEVIGWHIGYQKYELYYMMNTAIFEAQQGKGIYTKLLQEIISIVGQKGFLSITSRHIASNNKVLIPKLKAGFVITGMEIEMRFGVLLNLEYYFNKNLKDVYLMRTGALKPDDRMI